MCVYFPVSNHLVLMALRMQVGRVSLYGSSKAVAERSIDLSPWAGVSGYSGTFFLLCVAPSCCFRSLAATGCRVK